MQLSVMIMDAIDAIPERLYTIGNVRDEKFSNSPYRFGLIRDCSASFQLSNFIG
jgi:hypothetical protein